MSDISKIQYGGDIMFFTGTGSTTNPLAFSKSAEINIEAKTRDVSNKDSGLWDEVVGDTFNWNGSSDGLLCYSLSGVTGATTSVDQLFNMMIAQLPVNLVFAIKSGTSPSWTPAGTRKFTGKAIITSIKLSASKGENATYIISFTGSGDLVYS